MQVYIWLGHGWTVHEMNSWCKDAQAADLNKMDTSRGEEIMCSCMHVYDT